MGAGDEVPEALRQLGCEVRLLAQSDLEQRNLAEFDAIVTGVRAYNVRADLRANQPRLLDYVKNGGTLVVQYNVLDSSLAGVKLGPYPITLSRERVTVEEAPVRFPNPKNPLLHTPNRDYRARLRRLGAGARALLRFEMGPALRERARIRRPGRAAPRRRRTLGALRQGRLHLHRVFVVPPVARGRARGLPVIRNMLSAK